MISTAAETSSSMLPSNISEQDLFELIKYYGFGDLHFKYDRATNLQAIIAIHSTKLGPALGGCRFIEYPNTLSALRDVMRLAQSMSYKAALAGLTLGGGKSVILKPAAIADRTTFFKQFGNFVNELGGRYVTAMDAGTTEDDMNVIATQTSYVASNSRGNLSGNPGPFTALGTFDGIRAAVKHKFKRDDLKGLHVVIQGVGQVGFQTAKMLHNCGSKLTVCDVNQEAVQRAVKELNATAVDLAEAIQVKCDIFSPCALGGVINDKSINQINAPIVAGCANNQLENPMHGEQLRQKGILYAPDYVINAGGLIHAASLYFGHSTQQTQAKIAEIYDRLLSIFERSDKQSLAANLVADAMAKEIVGK